MFANKLPSEVIKIQQLNVETALAVAKYPTSGNFIDVSQFERFAFLIGVGGITSQTVAKVVQDTGATQTADVKDVTGATVTIAATGDNKWYLIEVQTSELDQTKDYSYVALDVTGPAGADDYAGIWFLGFGAGVLPVTQGTDCGAVVSVAG